MNSIPTTEKQAERAVVELFELYGWEVNVMREDIHVGSKGIPDLMMVSPYGLTLHIEMKRPASPRNPKGRVRKAQKARLIEWRRRGVACCVADGVGYGLKILVRLGNYSDIMEVCDRLMAEYEWWPA